MADLTSLGTAIGYVSTGQQDLAFDGNDGTYWNSNGSGLMSGNWIGRSFGKTCIVQTMYYKQPSGGWHIDAIKLQYSNDGETWIDIQTVDLTSTDTATVAINTYPGGSYFRVVAAASTSSPTSYSWMVSTIALTGIVIDTLTRRRVTL